MTAPLNQFSSQEDSRPERAGDTRRPESDLGLAELLGFMRRHGLLLILAPILTVGATLAVTLLLPRQYAASSTLLVSQLQLNSSIDGQPLPLHGLQWILESEPVVVAAEKRIAQQNPDTERIRLELGRNADTEMLVRRREESTLAPMIEVTTRGESPQLAIAMAQAWITAFVEHMGQLRQSELNAVLGMLNQELTMAEGRLRDAEAARSENREQYEEERAELMNRWRERLSRTLQARDERVSALRLEARDDLRAALEPYRDRLDELPPEALDALEALVSLRGQLAEVPSRFVLVASETPNSIVVGAGPPSAGREQPAIAFNEEVNPRYQELSKQAADAQERFLRVVGDQPQMRQLVADLESTQEQVSVERTNLELSRFGDLQLEERFRLLEEEALQREFELVDSRLGREVAEATEYRVEVATRQRAALMSSKTMGELTPIQVAAEAVSARPIGRDLPVRAAAAALAGVLLALGLAIVRDFS